MEHCTKWDYEEGQFGTRNTCDEAVFVQFSAPGKPSIEHRLKPGEILRTGLTRAQTSGLSWMFTTCPVGYISSVPLDPAGRAEIAGSHYSCIKK